MSKEKSYVRVRSDSKASAVEFVRPLLAEIEREIGAPEVDLLSSEAAAWSLQEIQETMRQLESFKGRVSQLKPLLEQEKLDLDS